MERKKMNETEVKCCRCGAINRIILYEPLTKIDFNKPQSPFPVVERLENIKLSNIQYVNKELSDQVRKLKSHLDLVDEFLAEAFDTKGNYRPESVYLFSKMIESMKGMNDETT